MYTKVFRPILIFSSLAIILMAFNACVKIEPTIAVIYVKNADGTLSDGAQVRLYGQPVSVTTANASQPLQIDILKQTDNEGKAYFDLSNFYKAGQTGVAILNVDIQKAGQVATGFIQIVEQQSNEKTFFLQ